MNNITDFVGISNTAKQLDGDRQCAIFVVTDYGDTYSEISKEVLAYNKHYH